MKPSLEIDRQRVAEAVQPTHEPFLNFAAGSVLVDEISLFSIQLKEIGTLKIPLSLRDAIRLKAFSQKQLSDTSTTPLSSSKKHIFEIHSSKFLFSILANTEINSLVIKQLRLPVSKTMNFKANLEKLILYEVDGQMTHNFNLEKKFGTFGTVILQLPVSGGHDGGNIHVKYKGRQIIFEEHLESDQQFFLTSFYNSCQYFMNPVTRGWKLTLMFNLVWTNSNIVIPADFIDFLASQKKLESALTPWIPIRSEDDCFAVVQKFPLPKENEIPFLTVIDEIKVSLNPSTACSTDVPSVNVLNESSVIDYGSLSEDEEDTENVGYDVDYGGVPDLNNYNYKEEKNCCCYLNNPSTNKCEEEVLFFVLEEKYFEENLKFQHLKGNDRSLADRLRCCHFIDVHLAKVIHTNTKQQKKYGFFAEEPRETKSTKISRWIDSNGVVKDLNIDELNWNEKCVGPIRNLLEPWIQPDSQIKRQSVHNCVKHGNREIHQKLYFHTILVIWPKHKSIEMYCRYGLGLLLNHMESTLVSARGWQALSLQQLTQDLHQAVEYCCRYPQRIWTQSSFRNGELTLRFLRLCIALRARTEGLEILKMLGSSIDIELNSSTLTTFEGIQTEQVAKSVVKFVCQCSVWDDCVDLIKTLITTHRITKQFVPIVKLIQYFLEFKCVKGAVLVGDCVASWIVNIDQNRAALLQQSDVSLYLDSIFSMEVFPEASSQERIASLVSLFPKLNSTLQHLLILQIDDQGNSRFKGIGSCQSVFLEICKIFQLCELSVPPTPEALELLNCFIRIGNFEWFECLISKMISVPIPSDLVENVFLKNLISSPILWKFATSSVLRKAALKYILDGYSTLVLKKAIESDDELDASLRYYLSSTVAECLSFVMRMERNPELADPQRIPSISLKLAEMNFEKLRNILDRFHQTCSKRFSIYPCYSNMIGEICKTLIAKMKRDIFLNKEAFLNVAWYLVNCLEKSLAQSLIKEVCAIVAAGNRYKHEKYEFFNYIISDGWSKLESISKLDILNMCAALIESWIIEECKSLYTNCDFSECARFFFLIEKHRFDPSQLDIIRSFEPYLEKLPLNLLKYCLLNLHMLVVTTKPCIRKFPVCRELFSKVCRHFVDRNFLSVYKSEDASKILNCLIWIDDDPGNCLQTRFVPPSLLRRNTNPFSRFYCGIPVSMKLS